MKDSNYKLNINVHSPDCLISLDKFRVCFWKSLDNSQLTPLSNQENYFSLVRGSFNQYPFLGFEYKRE